VDTIETLRAAKALISDPKDWLTFEYARDKAGKTVVASSPDACRFCAVGALAHIAKLSVKAVEHEKEFPAGVFLNKASGDRAPHTINDDDGHAAVLALYDRTIELAQATPVPSAHHLSR
jgi:hypothetical protein